MSLLQQTMAVEEGIAAHKAVLDVQQAVAHQEGIEHIARAGAYLAGASGHHGGVAGAARNMRAPAHDALPGRAGPEGPGACPRQGASSGRIVCCGVHGGSDQGSNGSGSSHCLIGLGHNTGGGIGG